MSEIKTALEGRKSFHSNGMEMKLRAQAHSADQPSKAANRFHDFDEAAAPPDLLSLTGRVQYWQQVSEELFDEYEGQGVVARLFENSNKCLHAFLQHSNLLPCHQRSSATLQRCHAQLRLWANGHGVLEGKLDSTLGRSKSLRDATLSILGPLCEALASGTSSVSSILPSH